MAKSYDYEHIVENLGQKLREIRKKKGMTLRSVSDLIGMEESNYSRFELNSASTNPTLKTILSICNALDIEIEDLL